MAWIKNLGNVKGDKGDIYSPIITGRDGKLHIEWEKKTYDGTTPPTPKDILIPIYIPSETIDADGCSTFSVSDAIKNEYGDVFPDKRLKVRGPAGGTTVYFETYSFTNYISAGIPDLGDDQPSTNVFYINRTNGEVYIYDGTQFVVLEALAMNDYYTTNQVYTKEEVNAMFDNTLNDVLVHAELIARLHDIEESFSSQYDIEENFSDQNESNNDIEEDEEP